MELIYLGRGTSGGPLWTRQWTFGFQKMRGISWRTISYSRKKSAPWS